MVRRPEPISHFKRGKHACNKQLTLRVGHSKSSFCKDNVYMDIFFPYRILNWAIFPPFDDFV